MNSKVEKILNNIIADLKFHKRPKSKILEYFINIRLNKSLTTYYDSLLKSENRLLNKEEIKIMRGLNKYGV